MKTSTFIFCAIFLFSVLGTSIQRQDSQGAVETISTSDLQDETKYFQNTGKNGEVVRIKAILSFDQTISSSAKDLKPEDLIKNLNLQILQDHGPNKADASSTINSPTPIGSTPEWSHFIDISFDNSYKVLYTKLDANNLEYTIKNDVIILQFNFLLYSLHFVQDLNLGQSFAEFEFSFKGKAYHNNESIWYLQFDNLNIISPKFETLTGEKEIEEINNLKSSKTKSLPETFMENIHKMVYDEQIKNFTVSKHVYDEIEKQPTIPRESKIRKLIEDGEMEFYKFGKAIKNNFAVALLGNLITTHSNDKKEIQSTNTNEGIKNESHKIKTKSEKAHETNDNGINKQNKEKHNKMSKLQFGVLLSVMVALLVAVLIVSLYGFKKLSNDQNRNRQSEEVLEI